MNRKLLIEKTEKVIRSCRTIDQLKGANEFYTLALIRRVKLDNIRSLLALETQFDELIEVRREIIKNSDMSIR